MINMENIEIERKWLMDAFPTLDEFSCEEMEQGYLSFKPAVRTRCIDIDGQKSYKLTIKGPGTLTRAEVELDLTKEQYSALQPLLPAPAVKKLLKRYNLGGGHVLECSLVDEGAQTAFYYAEIEFENEEEARAFTPPPFFGREVTEERGFTMAEYWRKKHGL